MKTDTQIEQSQRLLGYLRAGTTAMAEEIYRQPVDQYTSHADLERESSELFGAEPLLLGLSCELPHPGDFISDDFSGVPIAVVRQNDGSAKAMINVCRHRGARLLDGRGSVRGRLACPYHAWTYDLDGRLLSLPFEAGFEGMDHTCTRLPALPVYEWRGMIWVIPCAGSETGFAKLDPLADDLEGFAFDGYHHYETRTVRVAMNWKLVVDTFLESYHIQVLHRKTIAPYILTNTGTFDALGRNLRMIIGRTSLTELERQPADRRDLVKHSAIVYVLFPNTVLIMQGDHLESFRVYPDGAPDKARMHVSLYTPDTVTTDSADRHWRNNMDLLLATVEEEDFPLGENIQRDFGSGGQSHITFGRNEPALAHFHRMLDQRLER